MSQPQYDDSNEWKLPSYAGDVYCIRNQEVEYWFQFIWQSSAVSLDFSSILYGISSLIKNK